MARPAQLKRTQVYLGPYPEADLELLVMTLLFATPNDSFLKEYAETRRYQSGRPGSVKITADGHTALYLRSEANDSRQMLYALDLATGKESVLLTPEAVLQGSQEQLTAAEKARLERMRVTARGFTSYRLSEDGARVLLTLSGKLYLVERSSLKVTKLNTGDGANLDATFSPDAKHIAYVRNFDLYVLDVAPNKERQLTHGGTALKPNGLAEFVAQEEMGRFSGFWFSPDSQSLAYQQTDHTGVEQLSVVDPMHPEGEPERSFYPRAGRPNATVKLFVQSLSGGAPKAVRWDAAKYPYLATVKWKHGPLTLVVQNREQTSELVLTVDAKGQSTTVLTESDAAWVNLNQSFPLYWANEGFFWLTERNGAPEVELRGLDGSLRSSWVKPDAGFWQLAGFDPASKTLYFSGGPSPIESQVFSVTDGGPPKALGESGGIEVGALGADLRTLAVHRSTVSSLGRVVLIDGQTGKTLMPVPSVAKEPSLAANAEFIKLDGPDGAWAEVIRPANFTKGKKYPVILDIYGGPHHQQVTRTHPMVSQWLANQGFMVVRLDGRGTPRRGREWERAIAKDFTVTASDQVKGLEALGAKVSELDLTRVGVTGWSFGGYLAALLAMKHGEVVKAAVVGAPVVDWLDYDSHYTERYLGVPEGATPTSPAYERSSLLSWVAQAKRPMLIMHGTADDNVYFMHTLKLSDALFRAGVPHQVLPLSNFTHMVPEPLVLQRQWEREVAFFKETLQ